MLSRRARGPTMALSNSTICATGGQERGRDFSRRRVCDRLNIFRATASFRRCQTVGSTSRAPLAFPRKFKSFYDRTSIPVLPPRQETRNCPVYFFEKALGSAPAFLANFIKGIRFFIATVRSISDDTLIPREGVRLYVCGVCTGLSVIILRHDATCG